MKRQMPRASLGSAVGVPPLPGTDRRMWREQPGQERVSTRRLLAGRGCPSKGGGTLGCGGRDNTHIAPGGDLAPPRLDSPGPGVGEDTPPGAGSIGGAVAPREKLGQPASSGKRAGPSERPRPRHRDLASGTSRPSGASAVVGPASIEGRTDHALQPRRSATRSLHLQHPLSLLGGRGS